MILFLYTFKYNNKKLARRTAVIHHARSTHHRYCRHVDFLQKKPRDDCE